MLGGETVRHLRIPVVHIRGEIIAEQQRRRSAGSEAPVGELHIPSLNKLRACGLVRVIGHWPVLLSGFTDLDSVGD